MEEYRKDYSELFDALENEDQVKVDQLFGELTSRLIQYLQGVMGAGLEIARDCAQDTLLIALQEIKEDRIEKEKAIFGFLLTTCRREYYSRNKRTYLFDPYEDAVKDLESPPTQIDNLLDEERQQILEICVAELNPNQRKFIKYYFDDLARDNKDAMKKFKMSDNAVRANKSRIIHLLHACYSRKSKL